MAKQSKKNTAKINKQKLTEGKLESLLKKYNIRECKVNLIKLNVTSMYFVR